MTFFSIYSTVSLDFMDKKIIKVEIISRTPRRKISCLVCARWYIRKTVLKVQTPDWKIAWYLEKKKKKENILSLRE